MKINAGFWLKPQICPIGIFFLSLDRSTIKFNRISKKMAKNVLSTSRDIGNLSRDLNDMRQKPDFQREHLIAPKIYFMKKVASKGVD